MQDVKRLRMSAFLVCQVGLARATLLRFRSAVTGCQSNVSLNKPEIKFSFALSFGPQVYVKEGKFFSGAFRVNFYSQNRFGTLCCRFPFIFFSFSNQLNSN